MTGPSAIIQDLIANHVARIVYNTSGEPLGIDTAGGGSPLLPMIVTSAAAPLDNDGRPDGTLWVQIQTGETTVATHKANGTYGPGSAAPVNTAVPLIVGDGTVDSVLTCSTGTWTGAPTITYTKQWKRDGVAIATTTTYTVVADDVGTTITCTVMATNALGTASATAVGLAIA